MRSTPFDLVIYEDPHTEAARSRRPGSGSLTDEPATESHRSLAWLTSLARRRPAARARRATA
jgi:hypothetical protein